MKQVLSKAIGAGVGVLALLGGCAAQEARPLDQRVAAQIIQDVETRRIMCSDYVRWVKVFGTRMVPPPPWQEEFRQHHHQLGEHEAAKEALKLVHATDVWCSMEPEDGAYQALAGAATQLITALTLATNGDLSDAVASGANENDPASALRAKRLAVHRSERAAEEVDFAEAADAAAAAADAAAAAGIEW